jgi:two-component sensor histidine kinase
MTFIRDPNVTTLPILADVSVGVLLLAIALVIFIRVRAAPAPDRTLPIRALVAYFLCSGLAHLAGILAFWLPIPETLDAVQMATVVLTVIVVLVFAVSSRRFATGAAQRAPGGVDLLRAPAVESATLHEEAEALKSRRATDTAKLFASTQYFDYSILGANISVFQQDLDLRYTWMHNPPAALALDEIAGKRDEDVFARDVAAPIVLAKKAALSSGEPQTVSFELDEDGRSHFYDLTVHLLRDDAGIPIGLSSVAVDVSEHKAYAEKLQVVMRELAHRSKNLLAIIIGISNMTSKLADDPREFHQRFSERLRSLSDAHDALTETDWTGAELLQVVEHQTAPYHDGADGVVSVDGEPVWLKPNAVQYLTLALHELTSNAARHGALQSDKGNISISWKRITPDDPDNPSGLRFVWCEAFGVEADAPVANGFGRLLLEEVAPSALRGSSTLDIADDGLNYVLTISRDEFRMSSPAAPV